MIGVQKSYAVRYELGIQTKDIAFLETYCSEIAEQKMTIPLDEIRWKNFNKGLRNQILISFNGNDYEFIIPNHREITQLKDQHEEAEKIMKIAETATIDQNPLWINLLNR